MKRVPYRSVGDARVVFLEGGGKMGARMRGHDWTGTPLGLPAHWPQPLKTLVSLMLTSPQPMFIAWGEALTWIYNDAFMPVMGARHPGALGQGALTQVWSAARAALVPLFHRVFAGEPVHMKDFYYTPVRDELGRVAGLFGVGLGIGGRVRASVQKRILVVDENIDAGEGLKMLLQLVGQEVYLAHDAEQAVDIVCLSAPDWVVLDLGVPGGNGYEAARRIRALPAGNAVELIALIGSDQPGDRERAAQAGFDRHLTKPVALEALQELLQKV